MTASWTAIAVIAALFVSVGVAFDAFLIPKRSQERVRLALIAWWDSIDNVSLIDIHSLMAQWSLKSFKVIYHWRAASWQSLLILVIFSIFLTSTIGYLVPTTGIHFLPILPIYILNIVFDAITLLITFHALSIAARRTLIIAFPVLLFDICLAIILYMLCFASSTSSGKWYWDEGLLGTESGKLAEMQEIRKEYEPVLIEFGLEHAIIQYEIQLTFAHFFWNTPEFVAATIGQRRAVLSFQEVLTLLDKDGTPLTDERGVIRIVAESNDMEPPASVVAISATTLLPTILYLGLLVAMMVSKVLLIWIKRFTLHILEVITEPDKFKLGTLCGILFACIAAGAKTVLAISELVAYVGS